MGRGWRRGGGGRAVPAGLGCQSNWVVGDDCPNEGLHKGDWEAHYGSGQHKRPGWKEHVVPLLEEHRHPIDLHSHLRCETLGMVPTT